MIQVSQPCNTHIYETHEQVIPQFGITDIQLWPFFAFNNSDPTAGQIDNRVTLIDNQNYYCDQSYHDHKYMWGCGTSYLIQEILPLFTYFACDDNLMWYQNNDPNPTIRDYCACFAKCNTVFLNYALKGTNFNGLAVIQDQAN